MKKILFFIFFTFQFGIEIRAVEQKKEIDKWNVYFKTLAYNEDIPEVIFMQDKTFKKTNVSRNFISREFHYSGKRDIDFYQITSNDSDEKDLNEAKDNLNNAQKNLVLLQNKHSEISEKIGSIKSTIESEQRKLTPGETQAIDEFEEKIIFLNQKINTSTQEISKLDEYYLIKKNKYNDTKSKSNTEKRDISTESRIYLSKFSIPENNGKYILIFNKTPNGTIITPINDSLETFPFGSYQFFNITDKFIELRFGSKVYKLTPNGRTILSPPVNSDGYVDGEFWIKIDDKFKIGYSYRTYYISNLRKIFFISQNNPQLSNLVVKIAEERGQIEPPAPPENPKDKGKKNKETEKKEPENRPFG